ncbi:MAG: hypothetical protein ACE5J3_04415, partial [Methanosarcinales archaeon]
MPQNFSYYFLPSFPWAITKERDQETSGLEKVPEYVYVDIHGAEIAELRERITRLEQKQEQQIVPIQFLESKNLELKKPLSVNLSYSVEDEIWVIDCPELNIYGEGENEQKAIEDFKIVLEEFYFNLKKDREKLGLDLKKKF